MVGVFISPKYGVVSVSIQTRFRLYMPLRTPVTWYHSCRSWSTKLADPFEKLTAATHFYLVSLMPVMLDEAPRPGAHFDNGHSPAKNLRNRPTRNTVTPLIKL